MQFQVYLGNPKLGTVTLTLNMEGCEFYERSWQVEVLIFIIYTSPFVPAKSELSDLTSISFDRASLLPSNDEGMNFPV